MRREDVIRLLTDLEWEWEKEDKRPYRRLHYDKNGERTDRRTYLDLDDLVIVCQQFYLLGKHDK